jgi:hypothetical protein
MFKPQILMDRLERRELRQASAAELGLSGESPSRSSLLGGRNGEPS